MDPLVTRFIVIPLLKRGWQKYKDRKRKKESEMQFLQGKLTYAGLATSALVYLLDKFSLAPEGYDAVTVAGVLVGIAVAAYGRVRREFRKK